MADKLGHWLCNFLASGPFREEFQHTGLKHPVADRQHMIAVGTTDTIAGSAHELAALMPNARALDIPGRDHMLAVGDKVFKAGVVQFLRGPS